MIEVLMNDDDVCNVLFSQRVLIVKVCV